jgi:hypothetical protein
MNHLYLSTFSVDKSVHTRLISFEIVALVAMIHDVPKRLEDNAWIGF